MTVGVLLYSGWDLRRAIEKLYVLVDIPRSSRDGERELEPPPPTIYPSATMTTRGFSKRGGAVYHHPGDASVMTTRILQATRAINERVFGNSELPSSGTIFSWFALVPRRCLILDTHSSHHRGERFAADAIGVSSCSRYIVFRCSPRTHTSHTHAYTPVLYQETGAGIVLHPA